MTIEIVDFPIENGGSFHSYVNVPEIHTRPGPSRENHVLFVQALPRGMSATNNTNSDLISDNNSNNDHDHDHDHHDDDGDDDDDNRPIL